MCGYISLYSARSSMASTVERWYLLCISWCAFIIYRINEHYPIRTSRDRPNWADLARLYLRFSFTSRYLEEHCLSWRCYGWVIISVHQRHKFKSSTFPSFLGSCTTVVFLLSAIFLGGKTLRHHSWNGNRFDSGKLMHGMLANTVTAFFVYIYTFLVSCWTFLFAVVTFLSFNVFQLCIINALTDSLQVAPVCLHGGAGWNLCACLPRLATRGDLRSNLESDRRFVLYWLKPDGSNARRKTLRELIFSDMTCGHM